MTNEYVDQDDMRGAIAILQATRQFGLTDQAGGQEHGDTIGMLVHTTWEEGTDDERWAHAVHSLAVLGLYLAGRVVGADELDERTATFLVNLANRLES